jgi:hypothetical protein
MVRKKILKKQSSPPLSTKPRTRLPRLPRHEIRLRVVCRVLARRFQNIPQRLKPGFPTSDRQD